LGQINPYETGTRLLRALTKVDPPGAGPGSGQLAQEMHVAQLERTIKAKADAKVWGKLAARIQRRTNKAQVHRSIRYEVK